MKPVPLSFLPFLQDQLKRVLDQRVSGSAGFGFLARFPVAA